MKVPVALKDDDGYVLGERDSVSVIVFVEYFHFVFSKDNDSYHILINA